MKVGVLSFAHVHAYGYVPRLLATPGVEVLTTDPTPWSDPSELRGRNFADQFGAPYVETLEELLAWGPDCVVITSENSRHREFVEAAAAAGVHVLCEKPFATTLEDAEAMRKAVADAGIIFMMAFPVRFSSSFARLRATDLGEVLTIRGANNGKLPTARSWFTDPELAGGGALADHVVHIADLLDALRGVPAASVTATTNAILHTGVARAETAGLLNITYADGVVAAVDCSWSLPDTAPNWGGLTLNVTGTRGGADVDFFGAAVRGVTTAGSAELRYGADLDAAMLTTFLDGVRTGVQPQPDLEVGMRTLQIVLAAQESARTGRTVTV